MDVIVIGAGASGLMAAICAARGGANVTVIEQQNKAGKKLSITGNGKCNFTNESLDFKRNEFQDKYYGNELFISDVLSKFSSKDTIHFFEQIGIHSYLDEAHGGYYPCSNQAVSVTNAFVDCAQRLNIKIKTNNVIHSIEKTNSGFNVDIGILLHCDKLIIATGGNNVENSGMSGYEIAKQFHHTVSELKPALTALVAKDTLNKAAGIRFNGTLTLNNGKRFKGEIQITEYGISGIPVFNASHLVLDTDSVFLNFASNLTLNKNDNFVETLYQNMITYNEMRTVYSVLSGMIHEKILNVIFEKQNISKSFLVKDMPKETLKDIFKLLQKYPLKIEKRRGFDFAQVTQGGVSTDEIDSQTMESKKCDGLYFIGEVLDVDGICGGYNLQWAWSTGYLAGKNSSK